MQNLVVQASGVEPLPIGSYIGEFQGLEPYNNPDKGIINKFKFIWRVVSGDYTGKSGTALTDQKITKTNLCGRLISGMAGRALVDGEDVTSLVDGFRGQNFLVAVAAGPQGGKPGVQTVIKPPKL